LLQISQQLLMQWTHTTFCSEKGLLKKEKITGFSAVTEYPR
jgi:hypothetical protein